MRNASERKDIRRQEKAAKLRETQRIDFIIGAMSTKQGRIWFHDFLAACHIFADPFTGDALVEAYSKGERNMGLSVYRDIVGNCPDLFVQMMQEANEQEILNERRTESESDAGDSDGTDPDEFPGSPDADG